MQHCKAAHTKVAGCLSGHCVNGIFFNRTEKENLGKSSFNDLCPGLEAVLEEAEAKRDFLGINVSSTSHHSISTASDAESVPARKKKRLNRPGSHQKDIVNLLETRILDAVQELTTKVTDFKEANQVLERMSGTGSTFEAKRACQKDRVNTKRMEILNRVKDLSLMWGQLQDAKDGLLPEG